jgi:calcium/calmodulin-dependent protein kinase I
MVSHPQAVKLKEVFTTDEVCILVLELFERITEEGVFTEKYAAKFFRDLLLVVKHLHDQGIVHRDLKPENILLSDKTDAAVLKIIDFGESKLAVHDKAISGMRGTIPYMAPEIFAHSLYGRPVDMWALGVILYIILSGMFPYDPDERKFDCPFISPEFDDISEGAKDILLKLLDVNPETRYTADKALAHQWVTGESASNSVVSIANLRQMVARRRWKKAIDSVRTILLFRGFLKNKKDKGADSLDKTEEKKHEKEKEVLKELGKAANNLDAAELLLKSTIEKLTIISEKEYESAIVRLEDIKRTIHIQYLNLQEMQIFASTGNPNQN